MKSNVYSLWLSPSGLSYQCKIGPNTHRTAVCTSALKLLFNYLGPRIRLRFERYPFKGSLKFRFDGENVHHGGWNWHLSIFAIEKLEGYSIIYVRAENET